jgi:hypothetical protein
MKRIARDINARAVFFIIKEYIMINYRPDGIDYYNTIEELLLETDIIETEVHVLGWKKKFRVRALTFKQQGDISKKALNEKTGTLSEEDHAVWTLVYGLVRPSVNETQARAVLEKNGEYVKSLVDEIWQLGRISKAVWDAFIEENKTATE